MSASGKDFSPAVDICTIWLTHNEILLTEADAAHSCCGVEGAGLNKLRQLKAKLNVQICFDKQVAFLFCCVSFFKLDF